MLDEYEEGRKTSQVDVLFAQLGVFLPNLLEQISKKPPLQDDFLSGTFDKDQVMKFSYDLLQQIGYDFSKGRMDVSNHPFFKHHASH